MKRALLLLIFIELIFNLNIDAQPWIADLGNGKYKNPVIYADYSDPDIIRHGDDFYMVASSFNCMPGIPVLHSKDLVNWTIINHVYDSLPIGKYNKPAHGEGSWAPSIRFHNNKFYVYFCTPYDGLFVATADHPSKKWTLKQIVKVENWEDPCPLWDDDGNAYLVRSKFCGNALYMHKMSSDGMEILDNGVEIFRDKHQPTIEGPKFLKENGYYYIFAPAGGVANGWQTVLRSANIYGPYVFKDVLHTGNTDINGPHQGGMVKLDSGEWWFLHFQDKDMYGRIAHLQPMNWKDGWPLIGVDINKDGVGEPVNEYIKPNVGRTFPVIVPQTSDEFSGGKYGLQWQWHANNQKDWNYVSKNQDYLRLTAVRNITQNGNFWFVPNLLLQKFPAPEFKATTKIKFSPDLDGEHSGLVVMGNTWSYISVEREGEAFYIRTFEGKYDRCDEAGFETGRIKINSPECYLRAEVRGDGLYQFSYSFDNFKYKVLGRPVKASKGRWIGAKIGLFCINPNIKESKGFADFDWFSVE